MVCPTDGDRPPAANFIFTAGYSATFTNNLNTSYFVGVGADENLPQSILSGDRNLAGNGTTTRHGAYSPAHPSVAGTDVTQIATNASTLVGFTDTMHLKQGNVAIGDGSVQQVSSARFRTELLKNVDPGSYQTSAPHGNDPHSVPVIIRNSFHKGTRKGAFFILSRRRSIQ